MCAERIKNCQLILISLLVVIFLLKDVMASSTSTKWNPIRKRREIVTCFMDSTAIDRALSTLSNIDSVINLVKLLATREEICDGFENIFNKMKESHGFLNPQALQLAYEVKKAMDKETSQSLIVTYEAMKWSFPENIRAIIWSGKVKLRNVHFDEYLYAPANNHAYDSDRRNVYLWTDSSYKGDDTTALWRFETDDGRTFYIKSFRYDEYLYAAYKQYDNIRRQVFTWRPGTKDSKDSIWKIEIATADRIVLRSQYHYDEFLFASEYKADSSRRHVFTWMAQDDEQMRPNADGKWEVIAT